MIGVVLVDDHAVVRRGLSALLAGVEGIEVVGEASDGAEAVGVARAARPDVVLMDLEMEGVDGTEGTRRLLAAVPESRVVVLTSFSDRERILDALDAGAVGYLLKDIDPDDLVEAIRVAARGESPLTPRAASAVLQARTRSQLRPELSPREAEVLECLREGLPNKLIARRLEISEKTVKSHVTRILAALDVSDRTQAALWAQRHLRDR